MRIFAAAFRNAESSPAAARAGIGVWPHLDLARVRPIEEMQVWDGLSAARINFTSPTLEPSAWGSVATVQPMATLVENLNLQRGSLRFLDGKRRWSN